MLPINILSKMLSTPRKPNKVYTIRWDPENIRDMLKDKEIRASIIETKIEPTQDNNKLLVTTQEIFDNKNSHLYSSISRTTTRTNNLPSPVDTHIVNIINARNELANLRKYQFLPLPEIRLPQAHDTRDSDELN